MYAQAASTFRDIGDKNNMARALLNAGGVLQEQGDLSAAQKTFEDAIKISYEVNDKDGAGLELTALAAALDAEGEFALARNKVGQAISIDHENGRQIPTSDKLLTLGDIAFHQGDLSLSTMDYNDALNAASVSSDMSNKAAALLDGGTWG